MYVMYVGTYSYECMYEPYEGLQHQLKEDEEKE